MPSKKTWLDKLATTKEPVVKQIDIDFADLKAGSKMYIATPKIIEDYIRTIGFGKRINSKTLRLDLALANNADNTCPVTSGIFLRIVAEANFEKLQNGTPINEIAPFWRVIEPNSPIAKKLSFGQDFLQTQIDNEANF